MIDLIVVTTDEDHTGSIHLILSIFVILGQIHCDRFQQGHVGSTSVCVQLWKQKFFLKID